MKKHIATSKFYENPLIRYLGSWARWTVSTAHKAPLDMNYYLKHRYNRERFASLKNGNKPLVTLDKMKNDPSLALSNRAYRMNAAQTHIICIDVEPVADKGTTQNLLTLPAQYRELSMHNGYHMLLWVPNNLIDKKTAYIFKVSNIKGPTKNMFGETKPKKTPNGIEKEPMFEFINNKHYVTLTRKMIPQVKVDLLHNHKQRKMVKTFLHQLADYDYHNEQKRKESNEVIGETSNTPLKDLKKIPDYIKLASKIFRNMPENFQRSDLNITLDDYEDDNSRYEYNVLLTIKKQFVYCLLDKFAGYRSPSNLLTLCSYKDPQNFTWNDVNLAVFDIANHHFLHPRTKHLKKRSTYRDGVPWLLYEAQRCIISKAEIKNIKWRAKNAVISKKRSGKRYFNEVTKKAWPHTKILKSFS